MDNIIKYTISKNLIVRDALKSMDKGGIGFCVAVDSEGKVVGVLSDGDFRRAILKEISMEDSIEVIINKDFYYVNKGYKNSDVDVIFNKTVAQHIPVVDDSRLVDIITEESFYGINRDSKKEQLINSVVIMAGGKGTRLDPFTRILPKPLIPMGNDPIIKIIMDEFGSYGMRDFYITLNDKGKMIKAYFHDHNLPYKINFIEEQYPLGTAGALKLLQGKFKEPFFVSNCDIIIKSDYSDIFKFHKERENSLTLVGSMQHYTIPYGVCEIKNGGDLISIREKPQYDFLTNTGMYVLEPDLLSLIPSDTCFDMTDLIKVIQNKGQKVGVFPVSEKSWIDVGQWSEYKNAIQKMER
jgi:dTDP-glucose pyrophosphorylase